MGPIKATLYCMTHPFTWDGRATRSEYWWFNIVPWSIIGGICGALLAPDLQVLGHLGYETAQIKASNAAFFDAALAQQQNAAFEAAVAEKLGLVGLISLWPSIAWLAVLVRRLHDTGRSGWWFFISLVPFIGGIWLVVLTVLPSSDEKNEWGPPPHQDPKMKAKRLAELEPYMQPRTEVDAYDTVDAIRALRHARTPST